MSITHYEDVPAQHFENDSVKGVSGRVLVGKKDGASNFCMRLFEVSPGGYSPRHSHEWEHEIFVHQGSGMVFWGEDWKPVRAGNAIFIPGGMTHQIKNTGDAPLVFICLIPAGPPEL
ncbi:MAG: cupin domain-containing protein [Desulfatirhabdiaceae bacterium]